jgi:di/tricarboxylate transporter
VEAFDATRGSNVARGMFLILSYTANIFDKMIIAGAGSITARGLIEKHGGVEVLWSQWFLAFLPCSIITLIARLADLVAVPAGKGHARRRQGISPRGTA